MFEEKGLSFLENLRVVRVLTDLLWLIDGHHGTLNGVRLANKNILSKIERRVHTAKPGNLFRQNYSYNILTIHRNYHTQEHTAIMPIFLYYKYSTKAV